MKAEGIRITAVLINQPAPLFPWDKADTKRNLWTL